MLVHTETRNIQRSGVATEHNFTIKASSKAFNILSSNLYSDKPLAIIRELCCNAYDSHVEAGKAHEPIEVILPTRLNPTLTIKDNGIGLDHNGIINIYTKFFESTKTESNDFVGQLGLGSKAPFSMFKTFNVEARKNGVKRSYTAYINEDGIPTIAQLGEQTTDEANGVSVSMTVKADDFDKFHNAAKRALMYFNPKPLVNGVEGFKTYEVKHGIAGTNWKIRESDYWARMSGPYVVQGFVVYPIDGTLVREHGLSPAAKVISSLNIDFWMDIGSVDVAPSREALSYDKRTIGNIAVAFEQAAAEMRDVIQAEFDGCKTAYEAGVKLYKYEHDAAYEMRQLFNSLHSTTPFTWNGKAITYKHVLDTTKIRTTAIIRASAGRGKLAYNSRYEPTAVPVERTVQLDTRTAVLVDDVHRSSGDIVRQFINATADVGGVVLLKAMKKADHDEREIKRIIKMLGDVPVKRVSELPFKPTVKSVARSARSKESRLRFTGFKERSTRYGSDTNRKFSRLTWTAVDVDLSKGGFYLPLERFAVVYNGREQEYLDKVMAAAKALGLVSDADLEKTFGFNEKEIAKAGKNWVNFFDHVIKQFAKMKVEDKVIAANAAKQVDDHMRSFNSRIGARWGAVEPKLVDGAFKTFVNKVRHLRDATVVVNLDTINSFMKLMNMDTAIYTKASAKAQALALEWDELLKKHGMLALIDWYQVDNTTVSMVVDYINVVNAQ